MVLNFSFVCISNDFQVAVFFVFKMNTSFICLVKLEHDTVVAFQDQFLVRTYSPMKIVGGGIVEDIQCIGKWSQLKKYALKLSSNKNILLISFITLF